MIGDAITAEVHTLLYVVLSGAEKRVPLWDISWYHWMYNVISEVSH